MFHQLLMVPFSVEIFESLDLRYHQGTTDEDFSRSACMECCRARGLRRVCAAGVWARSGHPPPAWSGAWRVPSPWSTVYCSRGRGWRRAGRRAVGPWAPAATIDPPGAFGMPRHTVWKA